MELFPRIPVLKSRPDDDCRVDGIDIDTQLFRNTVHLRLFPFDDSGNQGVFQYIVGVQIPQFRENLQKFDDAIDVVKGQTAKIIGCVEGEVAILKSGKWHAENLERHVVQSRFYTIFICRGSIFIERRDGVRSDVVGHGPFAEADVVQRGVGK